MCSSALPGTSTFVKPIEQVLSVEESRALIALSLIPGIGPGKIRLLIAAFGSAQAVFHASPKRLDGIPGIGPSTRRAVSTFDGQADVIQQLEWAERAAATLIPYWDQRFPALLERIYDPPVFLWVRGTLELAAQPTLAVVGTRKPSAYGERVTADFVEALTEHGFVIISGLAYGIDAKAHRAALDAGAQTIAVLGSGIDRIYPSKHSSLGRDIVKQGALVSEFPLQAKPDAVNFPRRNRIISGLSLGTLVVEAFEKGGALITARLAIEHNREVFAVPGSIYSSTSFGCHQLIQSGQAKLVYSAEDILEELGLLAAQNLHADTAVDKGQALTGIERKLYEVLTDIPMSIDSICVKTDLDVSSALVYLLSLEFKGLVFQLAGKQFYRV